MFVLDEACLADASLHISSSPFENSDFADPEGGDIRRFIKPLLVAFARLSNSDPRAARILSEQVKRRSMVLRLGLIDSLKDVSNPALQRQLIDSVLRSQPLDFVVGAAMLQIGAVTKDALVEYGGELEALIAGSGTVEEAKRLGGQLEVVNSVIQRMIRKA